jgi:hypothetical protein
MMDRTIKMLGLQEPKSAKLPMTRKTTIWMAKEMPLLSRTILLMERSEPAKRRVSFSPAAW